MKSINKKITELENCVFDTSKIDLSTTKIAYESLSEVEQKIMDKAQGIAKYWSGEELTRAERTILDQAGQILTARIGWLFGYHYETLICGEDTGARFLFYTRLFWFLDEISRFINQYRKEHEIFDQKDKSWKQKEKEAEELYKTWKRPFTPESYDEYMKPVFARMEKDLKKKKR